MGGDCVLLKAPRDLLRLINSGSLKLYFSCCRVSAAAWNGLSQSPHERLNPNTSLGGLAPTADILSRDEQ